MKMKTKMKRNGTYMIPNINPNDQLA